MKGRVQKFDGKQGFINGEDGNKYFVHESDLVGTKKLRGGNIVSFTSLDEGKEHLKAVNVKKIGHGKHHPFIKDLNNIYETVNSAVIDEEEKKYRLRDVKMLMAYFNEIEDIEQCQDVRKTFRDKGELISVAVTSM